MINMLPTNPLTILTAAIRDPEMPSYQLSALVRSIRRSHPLPISL